MDQCRRRHPVLHHLAHRRLWRYYPRDYLRGRELFRRRARRAGLRLASREVANDLGLDLTVDVAVRGAVPGAGTLVHLAGTRGVDGYVGAAVQQVLLRHLDRLLPRDLGLVLVHCVNPYGMAMDRLTNENNVDLEHNVATEAEFAERMRARKAWNPEYAKVDHFINPTGRPPPPPLPVPGGGGAGDDGQACVAPLGPLLRSLWHWRLRGDTTYEDIQHRGQHWRTDGLAFGGFELQPSCAAVLEAVRAAVRAAPAGGGVAVLAAGVEASPVPDDTLWVPAAHEVAAMRMTGQYPHIRALPAARRSLVARLAAALPRCEVAVHQSFATQASRFRALQRMREENVQYHHRLHHRCSRYNTMTGGGRPRGGRDWAREVEDTAGVRSDHLGAAEAGVVSCMGRPCGLRGIFALEEEQWRERAALRGVLLALQAARHLGTPRRRGQK